jgi:uncharacterized delta-60 repeat protein
MAVARFTSTGFLDVTFGGDGWVTTDFYGSADVAFELMLQKDGKIVLVGYTNIVRDGKYETDFALTRYHPDGSLDTNYGDNGKVSSDFLFYDMARAAVMQPDGKVVAVGEVDVDTDVSKPSRFVVARYNLDGSLDASFDLDGWLLTDVSQYDDEGKGITMQPDGRIVVVGFSGDDITVVRYK